MVEEIGEELRNHSEVGGCGLRNKNARERDIVISWRLILSVSAWSAP